MSDHAYAAHMDQILRERKTEAEVRSLDAGDIVQWIHRLEDEIKDHEDSDGLAAEREWEQCIPEGWRIERTGDGEITVDHPDGGGVFVTTAPTTVAAATLYDLADAMLAERAKRMEE